jgi:arylsulfatase A-like enzyme
MNRTSNHTIKLCQTLALLCLTLTLTPFRQATAAETKPARPPNFILILADDLGAKELGCYGNRQHRTPHLDRLAAEGVRFETCYATPICSPTRVAIMTGQYGFRTGWFHLMGRPFSPRPDSPDFDIGSKYTFADLLKSRGYVTALVGKWQLSGKIPTLIHDAGFDEYRMWAYKGNLPEGVQHTGGWEDDPQQRTSRYWHPCIVENGKYLPTKPTDYGPDLFNEFVIDFMRRHKEQPFFIYYTSVLTHGPHVETPNPAKPGEKLPRGFPSNLEYLDHLMGRLVRAVDEMGLRENTVILFVGDNGTASAGKGTVTELGARVPFIVRCPGRVKSGVVSRELTDITDVLPTLAEFAGAELPKDRKFDGKSLVPVLRGEAKSHRDWIFSYLGDGRILRDKRWLLERKGDGTERFYDCGDSRDGTGYKNVTASNAPEVKAARERFGKILKDLPGPEGYPGLRGKE